MSQFTSSSLNSYGETAYVDTWPEKLKDEIPDIDVQLTKSVGEAMEVIGEVDAAFGNIVPELFHKPEMDCLSSGIVPELFERATNLKWIACPQAPQAGYYHQALIDSNVVVTNTREIYDDHISAHIMSFILAFARGLHVYIPRQLKRQWIPEYQTIHLPDATALIIGVGGIGGETARLCAEFGMTVIAVDPRIDEPPPGRRNFTGQKH